MSEEEQSSGQQVLAAYKEKFGKDPTNPNQLILFAKKNKELPNLSFLEARGILGAPKGAKRKSSAAKGPTFQVGDHVLITKDRIGIVKYKGKVHWAGDEVWYGLELQGGTLGKTDGTVDKKRYFVCEPNRGMFVPAEKVRRKLTKKDHRRQESYNSLANRTSEMREKNALGEEAESVSDSFQPRMESVEEDREAVEAILKRGGADAMASPYSIDDDRKAREDASSPKAPISASQPVDIEAGFMPADSYESVLLFVMKQKGAFRELLLDIYAHPALSPLITAAFETLKEMNEEDQRNTWPMLLIRWKRHL